ncbi:MAG TPA: 2-oxoglutarate dehydrogenase complex dihydrolipoyllysine-residue succinyltransferase [Mariprofundaceae bacterium]|nr:2-oxoglutarate dehydrogenase complex dihydrolipoyllysine-residue succinyltransferase [Mariprofundaceae bacterium]
MDIEIKVPSLGESESEATLVAWEKQVGDAVIEDDVLAEIESDKITMEITAFENGVLKEIRKQAGETVEPGEVVGLIEAGAAPAKKEEKKASKAAKVELEPKAGATVKSVESGAGKKMVAEAEPKPEAKPEARAEEKLAEEKPEEKKLKVAPKPAPKAGAEPSGDLVEERVPMSRLRRTIAKRLKDAQNTAAMLTTFNEVNMQPVMDLRSKYRDAFKKKHGVDLGFMSFFIRASIVGLKKFPAVNACIDGDDIVYRNHFNIGVAVSTEKGLVVPVIRDAGRMSMADIERAVAEYAGKAREGGLLPDDLKAGTFSITNGGVFGSLLSTPILNPPQSGILGMHKIEKRPVVENDQIVIRPMMYLALSYDHRLIDGREAVQFLVTVKDVLEYPAAMLLDL